jgi:hypothetical protein
LKGLRIRKAEGSNLQLFEGVQGQYSNATPSQDLRTDKAFTLFTMLKLSPVLNMNLDPPAKV